MCTILIAHHVSEHLPLLVLANRDEFYSRPTAAAAEWQEMPALVAGRDLASGGTWFGARGGRWASVTNIREGKRDKTRHHKSRGWLVLDYLQSELPPRDYLAKIHDSEELYAGYNLLLGHDAELWYASNRLPEPRALEPGIYGLSNALLDAPWPKVVRGKTALAGLLQGEELDREAAFAVMADTTLAADAVLPDTGVPYAWEKALSATFITMPSYGTRCTTLLSRDQQQRYRFIERSFRDDPHRWTECAFSWRLGEDGLTDGIS